MARYFPRPPKPRRWRKLRRGGRPRVPDKLCFESLVWLVASQGTWDRIPLSLAKRRTVQRRLRLWSRTGVLPMAWDRWLSALNDQDRLKVQRCLDLAGARKRAFWRQGWDLFAKYEARERLSSP